MADQTLVLTIKGQSREAVEAIRQVTTGMGQLVGAQVQVGNSAQNMGRQVSAGAGQAASAYSNLGSAIAKVAAALGAARLVQEVIDLGKAAVVASGQFEQAEVAFTTLLGTGQRAAQMLKDLDEFASQTPFNLPQVQEGARRLLAMGIAAQNVIPAMRGIGDAVSATGEASAERLGRVVTAIGQIQTKGKATAEEMNQLAEAGIPAYQILEKQLGLTKDQLGQLGKEGISAGRALDALFKGFQERFGGGMEKQAQTLIGQWSNLQDMGGRFLRMAGESAAREFTTSLRDLNAELSRMAQDGSLQEWAQKLGRAIADVAKEIGVLVRDFLRNPQPAIDFARAIAGIASEALRLGGVIARSGILDWLQSLLRFAGDHPKVTLLAGAVGFLAANTNLLAISSKAATASGLAPWLARLGAAAGPIAAAAAALFTLNYAIQEHGKINREVRQLPDEQSRDIHSRLHNFPSEARRKQQEEAIEDALRAARLNAANKGRVLTPEEQNRIIDRMSGGMPDPEATSAARRPDGRAIVPRSGIIPEMPKPPATPKFDTTASASAGDAAKRKKDAERLAQARKELDQMLRDIGIEAMPEGSVAQRMAKQFAEINADIEDQRTKLLDQAKDARIAKDKKREQEVEKALQDLLKQQASRKAKVIKDSEEELTKVREDAQAKAARVSREAAQKLEQSIEQTLQKKERDLFEDRKEQGFFGLQAQDQEALADLRVQAYAAAIETARKRKDIRPQELADLERGKLQADKELARLRGDKDAEQNRKYFDGLAKAAGEWAQSLAEGFAEMQRIAGLKRENVDLDLKNKLTQAEATGDVAKQTELLREQIARRKQDQAALGKTVEDQRKYLEYQGQIDALTQRLNQLLYGGLLRESVAQAESMAKTLAAIAGTVENIPKAAEKVKNIDRQRETQRAEALGGSTLESDLRRRLAEVQRQIQALGTLGTTDVAGHQRLFDLEGQEAELKKQLDRFRRTTWKDFWADIGRDATQALRGAFSDALAEGIEQLLGKKGDNVLKQFAESLRSILAKALADAATQGISEWIRGAVGGLFGGRRSSAAPKTAARNEVLPDDFVGPPAPGQVFASQQPAQQGKKAAQNIAIAGVQLAAGIMGIVDVFRKGKKDLMTTILQLVSSLVSIISAIPGGWGSIGRFFGGLFAEGGEPPVGRVSIVGERGPELFIPRVAGTIIPNRLAFPDLASSAGARDLLRGGFERANGRAGGRMESLMERLLEAVQAGGMGHVFNQHIENVSSDVDLAGHTRELGWLSGSGIGSGAGIRTAPTRA